MVQIIRDEEGNVTEVRADMIDLLMGNQIKARGRNIIVKKHGIFGIGRGVQVIRTEPVKKVKIVQDAPESKKKTRVRVNGYDLSPEDIQKMPDNIKRKLGV